MKTAKGKEIKDFGKFDNISLCNNCMCMTKTIMKDGVKVCGKCHRRKF